VDRAARRVAAEKRKEKKDAKKARARERTRARDALERLRRRQERDGSLAPPDDDDDDEDDDEDDDMAACLGPRPQPGSEAGPGVIKPAPERAGAVGIRGRDVGVPVRRAGADRGGT
jgi:hypothetical protein